MTIEIPDTVKIGGFDFKVVQDEATNVELRANSCWGDYSAPLKRIRLQTDTLPQECSHVFLHEVIHAINGVYLSYSLQEAEITGLSNGLFQVLDQLGVRFGRAE
ncbi:hypothetical protein KKH13_04465 [Patescibacteria group bacterium]|uniref:Uncharacterized protein n=1 Tax=viral metagenome TaxID=1070528 RepID=A0A6M3KU75_9ZZZZ|nr:hypothetical protein [Patescibacteria group bacterium]